MVSGSDEHGTPVTITAEKENKKPQQIVDRYHKQHKESMNNFGISFDLFTRTTTKNHKQVVQEIFSTLYKKGYIYEKKVESFYCDNCQRFLPDRYIEGTCPHCGYEESRGDQCDECGKILDPEELLDVKCKICGGKPKVKETNHLFFALSKFEQKITNWLKDKDHWRKTVLNFTQNWLKEGLEDRAITRDMKWGIKVPIEGFENKRIYVWFDAVIGYLAASKEWAKKTGKPDKWEEWWKDKNAKHYYFLAKDNIPFHSLIWPSILLGYNQSLNLPYNIPANEYLRLEGKQFSKSRGLAVWVPEIIKKFDVDAIRYYLSINMPEKKDTNWSWEDFVKKNNDELVGTYGNFIHRVLTFTYKNFGEIPKAKSLDDLDKKALNKIEKTSEKVANSIDNCNFKKGLKHAMKLAQFGNIYFNKKEPWNLIKKDKNKCKTVLNTCLRITKALSILMAPYLPFSSEKIWKILGEKEELHKSSWQNTSSNINVGYKLEKPKPLFKKLSFEKIMENKKDPFSKLDLRVGKIVNIKDHPNADKLYMLQVDLGEIGKKVLVAGIKPHYTKEQLKNKKIVVVNNLKPAKIRGVKSNGMLLAAEDNENTVSLLKPGEANPGSTITIEEIERDPKDILDFDEFKKVNIIINENQEAIYKNKNLLTKKGKIVSDKKVKKESKVL